MECSYFYWTNPSRHGRFHQYIIYSLYLDVLDHGFPVFSSDQLERAWTHNINPEYQPESSQKIRLSLDSWLGTSRGIRSSITCFRRLGEACVPKPHPYNCKAGAFSDGDDLNFDQGTCTRIGESTDHLECVILEILESLRGLWSKCKNSNICNHICFNDYRQEDDHHQWWSFWHFFSIRPRWESRADMHAGAQAPW